MVKNKVCKKLYLASAIAVLAFGVPAFGAEYDIKDFSTTADSLTNHSPEFQSSDTINIHQNLSADANLPQFPSITVNGNGYSLDGAGSYSGFAVDSAETLTINNYLLKNFTTSLTNAGTTTINAQKGIAEIAGNIINEGTLNLNSGTNGYVKIENIASTNAQGVVNINSATDGTVKISGTVENQTVNLNGGMLTLGDYAQSGANYFQNSALDLNSGSINTANGEIAAISLSDLSVTNPTNILFDANLAQGTSDSFSVANPVTGSGSLKIQGINILADATEKTTTLTLFENSNSPTLDTSDFIAYTNDNKYAVKAGSTPGQLVIDMYLKNSNLYNYLAEKDKPKTFSLTGDYVKIDDYPGNIQFSELYFYGNGKDFEGSGNRMTFTHSNTVGMSGFGSYDITEVSAGTDGAIAMMKADGTIGYYVVDVKSSVHGYNSTQGGAFVSTAYTTVFDLSDSVFTNNTNTKNGTVFNFDSTRASLDNTVFIQNSTSENGGAIRIGGTLSTISDSIFDSNTVQGIGGGVSAFGDDKIISNTVFTNNSAQSYYTYVRGGGLYSGSKNMSIYDSTFINNSVVAGGKNYNADGGAIFTYSNTVIKNSYFSGNSTSIPTQTARGGAIAFFEGSKYTSLVENSKFFNNKVFGEPGMAFGGAIYNNHNLTIKNSEISNNSIETVSRVYGGGIASETYFYGENLKFESNTLTSGYSMGGAIYTSGTLFIKNSVFDSNIATGQNSMLQHTTGGGAIFVSGDVSTIIDSSFTNNRVNSVNTWTGGGAIFANNDATVNIIADAKNVVFEGNMLDSDSNAITINNAVLNLNAGNSSIIFNDAITNQKSLDNSATININQTGEWDTETDLRPPSHEETQDDTTVKVYDTNNLPTYAPTTGTVVLNADMSGYGKTVNLYAGTLKLGENGIFFNASDFNMYGGTLDLTNGKADTLSIGNFSSNDANLVIDVTGVGSYDKFELTGTATGSINIGAVNFTNNPDYSPENGGGETLQIFNSAAAPEITVSANTYTNDYKYYIIKSDTAGAIDVRKYDITGILTEIVANATIPDRSYTSSNNLENTSDSGLTLAGTSLTLDGGGYDLDGKGKPGFVTSADTQFVRLDNFGYKSADGTIISSIHDFTSGTAGHGSVFDVNGIKFVINDTIFKDNTAPAGNGGVMNTNSTNVYITNSDFINNSSLTYGGALAIGNNSTLTVLNSDFTGNSSTHGGAIYSTSSTLQQRVFGSTFTSNTASVGGAIRFDSIGWVNGSIFTGNKATSTPDISSYGGAIFNNILFVSDSTFTQNTVGSYGGAIASGRYLIVSGSTFDSNIAGNRGSAISADGKAVIYNSVFKNNENTTDGGTIGHTGELKLALVGSVFNNNTAAYGGGVYSSGAGANPFYVLLNNTFNGNSATETGGAVMAQCSISIFGSTFDGNSAKRAGAVYESSSASIYNSVFTGNSATEDAGGALLSRHALFVSSSIFGETGNGNTAANNGGAIYISPSSFAKASIINSTFTENTAKDRGGAIYAGKDLTVNSSVFTSNTVLEGGGAIAALSVGLKVNNSVFSANAGGSNGGAIGLYSSNVSGIVNSSKFVNNTAERDAGGAIYQYTDDGSGTLHVYNSNFEGNSSRWGGAIYTHNKPDNVSSIVNSVFSSNSSTVTSGSLGGGAIGGHYFSVINSDFTGNTAEYNGGAIYGGIFSLYNSTFTSNTAKHGGGAIYGYDLNINNSDFISNSASIGGAVYITGGTNYISGSTFTSNKTSGVGGAIYAHSGSTTVSGSTFTDNTSGAIFIDNGSSMVIENSFFDSNTGRTVANGGGTITINNSTFDGNHASSAGGAFFNSGSSGKSVATVTGSKFINNYTTANQDAGGAIYNYTGTAGVDVSELTINSSTFTGNTGRLGGAIYGSGYTYIYTSIFTGNKINDASLAANKGTFGGAVFSSLLVDSARFTGNEAEYGGAYAGYAQLTNLYFESNSAIAKGGAAYINPFSGTKIYSNLYFKGNTAGTGGGALYFEGNDDQNGTLKLVGAMFEENYSTNYDGGAILLGGGATLDLDYTSFVQNTVKNTTDNNDDGGAIRAHANSILNINHSVFSQNKVQNSISNMTAGGAIYLSGSSDIKNSAFQGNYAENYGGAIYNAANSMTLNNVSFSGNSTGGDGGAVYGSGFTGTNVAFADNTASNRGGAIVLNENYYEISLTNAYFGNNSGGNGGAIYNNGTLNLENVVFAGNTTNLSQSSQCYGGALYNSGTTTITNGVFTANHAKYQGGAIYNSSGTLNLINTQIVNNLTDPTDSYGASNGGGMWVNGTVNVTADKGISTIMGNKIGSLFNAAHLYGSSSVLNFSAENDGFVKVDGTINSQSTSNNVNYNGGVIFSNGTFYNLTMNVNSGSSIYFGANTSFADTNLNISRGSLHFTDGTIQTHALNIHNTNTGRTSYLSIDMDLANNTSDKFTGTMSGNAMQLVSVNIMSDAAGKSFDIGVPVTTGSTGHWKTYTNDYGYYFTVSGSTVTANQTSTLGLDKVWSANGHTTNSFSLTKDYALGAYGKITSNFNSGEGLFLHGNKHSINASGMTNFLFNTGNYLNVLGVGEYDYSTGTVKASWNGFEDASAFGGGIFEISSSGDNSVLIGDSVFYNNKTTDGGPVAFISETNLLKVNNSVFVSNSATNSSAQGGVFQQYNGATVLIADSLFKTNSSGNHGGAIYTGHTTSTLAITGSTFDGNTASSNGGAIYSAGTTNIYNSTFTNNTATQGGAIYNASGTTNILSSVFRGNKVGSGHGAAIFTDTGATTNIIDSEFYSNGQSGTFAILYNKGTLNVIGSTFGTKDGTSGQNIASNGIFGGFSGTVNIIKSDFFYNYAELGSVLKCDGSVYNIVDSYFGYNYATRGGALDGHSKVTVTGSTFEGNKAMAGGSSVEGGGAICGYWSSEWTISGSIFTANTAANAYGGAIILHGVSGSEPAPIANIYNSTFTNNSSGQSGGAIWTDAGSTLSIYNSDFSGNSGYRGGAIFNSGTTTVVNSLFDANISVDDGSAIDNTSGATLTITNSTFQNHTPSGKNANGGAIYSLGELTINTSKFINNTLSNNSGSNGKGGAILANSTTTINTTE